MRQTSIFDALPKYKINKPIRLIELFAGYGSQALALKYLGVPFEHWKIAEWAVKSIQAYKDLHMPDDNTDYSAPLRAEEVYAYLLDRGISADYSHPMTHEQIRRLGESKARQIYNNIQATHNLVSVVSTRGGQLQITDVDKYCYVLTYSFPCQDLSLAGKRAGMMKGGNTRSGLLWEVERILKDLRELPQVLLMENVPEVAREPNRSAFLAWIDSLAEMGYRSYAKNLNAKDYGVPQNRNRCYMVSLRGGEGEYTFPQPKPLETPLKAVLEPQVGEKYYLSPEVTLHMLEHRLRQEAKGNTFGIKPLVLDDRGGQYAKTITCGQYSATDTFIAEPVENAYCTKRERSGNMAEKEISGCKCIGLLSGGGYEKMHDISRRVYDTAGCAPTLHTCGGGKQGSKIAVTADNGILVDGKKCRIRILTPRERFRLMGVKDEDFDKIAAHQSESSLNHLSGDSIVVDVLMAIFGEMIKNKE